MAYSKDSLYNKSNNSKSAIDWKIYKLRIQKFSKLLRTKKSIHHKKIITENSKITKKNCKKINPYINPKKKYTLTHPSSLKIHVPLNLLIYRICSPIIFRKCLHF